MKKENIPLVLGLAIPVLMVAVLAAIIFLPRLYLKPTYDFVYAVGSYPIYIDADGQVRIEYLVVNGQVTKQTVAHPTDKDRFYRGEIAPRFYRYQVETDQNVSLTDEEVAQLSLDPSPQAPDGFELNFAADRDNIFEAIFGERDHSQRVLEKGSVAKNVSLAAPTNDYRSTLVFIGWVKE